MICSAVGILWLVNAGKPANPKNNLVFNHFGSAEKAHAAGETEYGRIDGLASKDMASYMKKDISEAEDLLFKCRAKNIG